MIIISLSVLFLEADVICAAALLKKYISLVCYHISEVLQLALREATRSQKHFAAVFKIISADICGMISFVST